MRIQIARIEGIKGESLLIDQFHTLKYGLCLDFNGAAGLTKPQVQRLVKELQNWLGETELPWKSNGQIAFENYVRNTHSYPNLWKHLSSYQQRNWERIFP